jgi:thiamine transport system permease protein
LAVLLMQPGQSALAPADWAAVRFTLVQAALSAVLSCALAVPVARALARRRFPGRGALVALLGAPFLMPGIVAVLGLLAVFGRTGWVNDALGVLGLPAVQVYGLQGVVLVHVFLNLPLAVRMLLLGWQAIPGERFRLASSLGFGPAHVFRHLEAPMLREVLPGAALVIFAVCLTSFAVALTLGGGPGATTVELAIYQALRFDFDLAAAARLALVQVALCGLAFAVASRLALPAAFGAGLRVGGPVGSAGWRRWADGVVIALAAAFVAAPLLAVAQRGVPHLGALPPEVWRAAGTSVLVALAASALATSAALVLALGSARGGRVAALAGTLPVALSSLALGTGLFLALRPFVPPGVAALPVTVAVNALLALPFAFRLILPEAVALRADYGRLTAALGLTGTARLRWVVLPRLARPLGLGAGLAAALAMGDLGVIALFATGEGATLPLVVQRLMGAYRMDQAAAASVVLLVLAFGLFAALDAGGRRAAA